MLCGLGKVGVFMDLLKEEIAEQRNNKSNQKPII